MQTELKQNVVTRLLEEPVRTLFSQLSREKAAILYTTQDVMWTGHILAIDGREGEEEEAREVIDNISLQLQPAGTHLCFSRMHLRYSKRLSRLSGVG